MRAEILGCVQSIDWFSRIGQPKTDSDSSYVLKFLHSLGVTTSEIQYVATVQEAEDCIKNQFDPRWDSLENEYRQSLLDCVNSYGLTEHVEKILKYILDRTTDRIMNCADERFGDYDQYLPKVGAGSALEVCYQFALEKVVARENRNTFTKKFEIYKIGRWPLCLSGPKFVIF